MRSIRYALLGLILASAVSAQPSSDPVVRVRLLSRNAPSEATVAPLASTARVLVDGAEAGTLTPGEAATVTRRGADVRVRLQGQERSGRTVRIESQELRFRAGRVDRHYPGALVFGVAGGHLEIVNHTPIEPYVASVVQSEFGFAVLEGAKAQAVLARTYALRRIGAHATYDLDDHDGSQVYRGTAATTPVIAQAAEETRGEVLTYRGELADAYYYSSSGGYTADNDAVWNGAPIPYLRAVPDPYDSVAPDHTWQTSATRGEVLGALRSRYGSGIQDIEVGRRSRSNRILSIRLVGGNRETITGAQFRQAVNSVAGARTVRSTRFEVTLEGDRYVFRGSGFGHGVGMSQYGALGQARAGRTYRDILAHYFSGTAVQPGPGLTTAPPVLVAEGVPAGTSPAAISREPSSLRTRYQPASGRRWPTPRHIAREQEADARASAVAPVSEPTSSLHARAADADTPGDSAVPRRRRAW